MSTSVPALAAAHGEVWAARHDGRLRSVACSPYRVAPWSLVQEDFVEERNVDDETLFAVANGYLGIRGTFEEGVEVKEDCSIPGTYINGFHDIAPILYPESLYGMAPNHQAMLNVADCVRIRLYVDGERLMVSEKSTREFSRRLEFDRGMLERETVLHTPFGKQVKITARRLVSFSRPHLAWISYTAEPLNFTGEITLQSVLTGDVRNLTMGRDPRVGSGMAGRALRLLSLEHSKDALLLHQRTTSTNLDLKCGITHVVHSEAEVVRSTYQDELEGGVVFRAILKPGQQLSLQKYASFYTSLELPVHELEGAVRETLGSAVRAGPLMLLSEQHDYMKAFWERSEVSIDGDPSLEQGLRFSLFHLLQSAGKEVKSSITAKGLTGEGYGGHVFWDTEAFIVPVFAHLDPQIAATLLRFRYEHLDAARERARIMGHPGALFAWRTINGEEASAYYPAGTAQYHINAAIGLAVRQYQILADDWEFVTQWGAEIVWETARLWPSLGHFASPEKFSIDQVTGPDEYTACVNNNAYTNLMAQAHLRYAVEIYAKLEADYPEEFKRICAKIALSSSEVAAWRDLIPKIQPPRDTERGLIAQDDSFLAKRRWDFENTPAEKYPLLIHFHPLVLYRHQVIKQADVVLALWFLGEQFTEEEKRKNFLYYEALTTHDSSLSPAPHGIVAAAIGELDWAYHFFTETTRLDIDNTHRNVKHGVHCASMAGSWLTLVDGFAGRHLVDGVLHFRPQIVDKWKRYQFRLVMQGRLLQVTVTPKNCQYTVVKGEPLRVVHWDTELLLEVGKPQIVPMK